MCFASARTAGLEIPHANRELVYVGLIFGLLVLPRALQRYKIPAPLSSFGLGMAAALMLDANNDNGTLSLLSILGISSLFLFAGLEIDLIGMRRAAGTLFVHLGIRTLNISAITFAFMHFLSIPWQKASLISLALMTPSTGFILESLGRLGLGEQEQFWVTTKAIGGEMVALIVLFIVLQSDSMDKLAWSSGALVAMIVGLPLLFIVLGRIVVPHAPGSEFSLLVMVGLLAAYLTKSLGVYYLVGAFVAGLTARLLRDRMPDLASPQNLHAVKLFASFFVPFYFFYDGMQVPGDAIQWDSLRIGLALTLVFIPLRVGFIWIQRRLLVEEDRRSSFQVALALTPTLIFTLVLATILRERFGLSESWYGGLLVYAASTTMLPSIAMSKSFDLDVTDVRT